MQCPKHKTNLILNKSEDILGHRCTECHGVYLENFAYSELHHLFYRDVFDITYASPDVSKPGFLCPGCKNDLSVLNIRGVELDVCKKCKGIWFDKNEVTKLVKKYGKKEQDNYDNLLTWLGSVLGGF